MHFHVHNSFQPYPDEFVGQFEVQSYQLENLALDVPAGGLPPVQGVDFRSAYTFNSTIAGIEDADALLLVGTNPRHEGAIVNTRIRKAFLHNGLDVGLIGEKVDLTYDYNHVGSDAKAVEDFIAGKGSEFAKQFKQAKKPMIIVGSGVTEHVDGPAILSALGKLVESEKQRFLTPDWNGFNILQRTASKVGAYDIGFVPTKQSANVTPKFVYLLNADDFSPDAIPKEAPKTLIYIPNPNLTQQCKTTAHPSSHPTQAATSSQPTLSSIA